MKTAGTMKKAEEEVIHKLAGFKTYPKVFIGNKCIGGCDDTIKAAGNG